MALKMGEKAVLHLIPLTRLVDFAKRRVVSVNIESFSKENGIPQVRFFSRSCNISVRRSSDYLQLCIHRCKQNLLFTALIGKKVPAVNGKKNKW